ncbi:MAG TPA: hypothetical protein VH986_10140 [Acidimicrobiia bacterium]|jgi:hypothetical protein
MLTVDELRALARQAVASGRDGPAVLAEEVLPHLDSQDRNVRVAALRALAFSDGPAAVEGILRGLDDPVRRVREVAAKSAPRFVSDPLVVVRLRKAVERAETGSARPAMEVLGGTYGSPYGLAATEPVADALTALADHPRYRRQVLLALLRVRDLTPDLTALLRTFVRDGTKEEAVFATRRLDGFRVAHDNELKGDTEVRRNADRAWPGAWYWVPANPA